MQKRYFLIATFLIACFFHAVAQKSDINRRNSWLAQPAKHTLRHIFDSSSAICLLDEREADYRNEDKQVLDPGFNQLSRGQA